MGHAYYDYTKEQLLDSPKIPLSVYEDGEAVFRLLAEEMAAEIRAHNKSGDTTVLICPVGPVGQYPHFVRLVNEESISLRNTWFINMDEYLDDNEQWIDASHKLSFRGFMNREVYGKITPALLPPEEQRVFPDPGNPGYIPELIRRLGGVDLVVGGVGINGHVAFNEPQPDLTAEQFRLLETRALSIAEETRATNCIGDLNGAIEDMPRRCVTVGFREIYEARRICLGCFRDWHRAVVRRACHGEVSTGFPVTLLQEHPNATIHVPEAVAVLP
ncbi:glucosamine-6-phosphate isomerase [Ruminococcaceae bacterium OttesenSCG-928-L11]|nr:glucosamine-6-phosphate isomerase [Ruminococcaceae bacterium OttesenSCG-928-L11]